MENTDLSGVRRLQYLLQRPLRPFDILMTLRESEITNFDIIAVNLDQKAAQPFWPNILPAYLTKLGIAFIEN